MVNVLSLTDARRARELQSRDFNAEQIRQEHGLSLVQAAELLRISTDELQKFELGDHLPPALLGLEHKHHLSNVYAQAATRNWALNKNVIFGTYPLSTARQLTSCTLEQLAARFGYTQQQWSDAELNKTILPDRVIEQVEEFCREH